MKERDGGGGPVESLTWREVFHSLSVKFMILVFVIWFLGLLSTEDPMWMVPR